jgi:hypothetical protein
MVNQGAGVKIAVLRVSGRLRASVAVGGGNGYLKEACDYMHQNPARAGVVGSQERLLAYPWSSLVWYKGDLDSTGHTKNHQYRRP